MNNSLPKTFGWEKSKGNGHSLKERYNLSVDPDGHGGKWGHSPCNQKWEWKQLREWYKPFERVE